MEEVCRRSYDAARAASEAGPTVMLFATTRARPILATEERRAEGNQDDQDDQGKKEECNGYIYFWLIIRCSVPKLRGV